MADLDDGDTHEAHSVVWQQLHFDGWVAHEGQSNGAKVGCHRGQPNFEPQLALKIQV